QITGMDKTWPTIILLGLVMMLAEYSTSPKNFEIGHCLPADKVILPINFSEEAKTASFSLTYRCANNNHIYGSWYSDGNYALNKSNNVSIQNNGSLVLCHPGIDLCATINVTLHVHNESKSATDRLMSVLGRSGEAICENNTVPKNEDNNGIEEPTPGDDELPKKPPGETNTGAASVLLLSCTSSHYIVQEGHSIVLPCGNGHRSRAAWSKQQKQGNFPLDIIRHFGDNKINVYPPWSLEDVELVSGISLKIKSASYPRDDGTFECIPDGVGKTELIVL
ncbi:uncharacterized protein LOC135481666, partial [Liolophura sinensis]|uniref:uncharacterized protein LOC135481666 n=1 Tax=Liolophura sinensis TaxID=3198878 RepID=UPI003158C2FB